MNAKRLFDPRWTAALAITAALCAFPARPAPAQDAPRPGPAQRQEDPRPGPAQRDEQSAPQPKQPEKAEATTGDAEILAQVMALDENEVDLARAAGQKNVTGPVQRYAKMIEEDHGRDMQQVRSLASTLGLTLTTTTTVDQLHAKGQEAMSRLAPLTGEQFSRTFMTEMVNGHREALQMLDDFLKTAQNDELKKHLTEARAKIAMHLREGEKIQAQIGRTDRPAPSSSEARPEQPLMA
jgi:predicted outer membrane protein